MTKPKVNRFADLLGARETPQTEDPHSEVDTTTSPKSKRLNKDYTQVSALIRRDTHKQVKAALIFDDEKRDFSDLLEQLLQEWLTRPK